MSDVLNCHLYIFITVTFFIHLYELINFLELIMYWVRKAVCIAILLYDGLVVNNELICNLYPICFALALYKNKDF